ncbi:dinucleotide-utilizing protein [Amycolatopsis sp. WAC 01375]|nr:dinucleotide-utilizing protein [Amycolatopsis sp. WAC 01375]
MLRPKIKSGHQPFRYGENLIRIGGIVRGIAADVRDPDGWVWALLETLDGTRMVDQVVADLVRRFPAHPESDVREALDDFVKAGYVEDAFDPPPPELTAAERERYGRSRALYRQMDLTPRRPSWDAQMLLRQSRVVVVGVGGIGGTAALALTASGVGHVHCVEPDLVELSNLNRQILYTEQDVGEPKIDAAVRELRARNSDVTITGEHLLITGPDPLRRLATCCDVLVLAADRPAAIRSWANQACHATGTAWVHGGYHGPQINIGLYRPGVGPCWDCGRTARLAYRAEHPVVAIRTPEVADTGPQAVNAMTAGMAGNYAALAVVSLITGIPAMRTNCETGLNLVTSEDNYSVGLDTPRLDCPTCGTEK